MSDRTAIEWTEATWNVINGCAVVSPGCTNCYAMRLAGTRFRDHPTRAGLTVDSKAGPVWNGQVRFIEQVADQPLRWRRPRRIFVCAHGDLFHESVPDAWIDRVFAVMALAHWHTFQILTKRPERMRAYLADRAAPARILLQVHALLPGNWRAAPTLTWGHVRLDREADTWHLQSPFPNVWLGVSVEDQARADERIPLLLDTPAAVRWISAEPLLGPVDLASNKGGTLWIGGQRGHGGAHRHHGQPGQVIHGVPHKGDPRQYHHHHDDRCGPGLDWVVAGGESGPGARPMHPDWARQLRDQCAAAGVPFLFKQWGEWAPADHAGVAFRGGTADRLRVVPEFGHDGGDIAREQLMERVGKKAAGRLLDGVQHDGYPEARS